MKYLAKIEVKGFKKSFGEKVIHQNVSFYVRKGECLGLVGGSGTGKSVLLRSLIGLEKPDQGQILLDGVDIMPMNESELVDVRKRVAYAFQDGALFDSMSVYENLAYPLREHTNLSESEIQILIRNQLKEFGVDQAENLFPANLSGGMQKRVGLARAMMLNPEVVLYDEPTAGLDPFNTKKIQESVNTLKARGVTSILVTHDMPTALAVCEKIIFLRHGTIAEQVLVKNHQLEQTQLISQFMEGELA